MPELDNIPILRNEMYNKPVKEKGIKKTDENGTVIADEPATYIENAE